MSFRQRQVVVELPSHVDYLELPAHRDVNDRSPRNLRLPPLEMVGAG